jgi:putative hemolysin
MELLILLLLIVLNGVFAMSEMAVVSSRKVRLQQWADDQRPGAAAALALANEPSTFLSTIQVGITVIGITSGAFGEATLAKGLSEWLSQWQWLDDYSDGLSITLVVAGITVASLIIGELVPKRLALLNPEAVASLMAKPMRVVSMLAHPVVRALSLTTDAVLSLLGLRRSSEPPVTEEEIKVLLEQGMRAGVFAQHEPELVARAFRLDTLKVTGVMTPRVDIVYLDTEETNDLNLHRIAESGHSRFPVTRGGLERVEGIVETKAVLNTMIKGQPVDLSSRVKPLYVPTTMTVMDLLKSFKKNRRPIALVVNEHGDLQGLVTLHDVMEALVGDIPTAEDEGESDIVRRADGSWLMDGAVTIERFKDVVGLDELLPQEDAGLYQTVGGFAMMQLERVPQAGDAFVWDDWRFEVVDMDRNRVDKLIATRVTQ